MSKYSFPENSLLAEIFLNSPFAIVPIKLKLLKGILDLVIKLLICTSISLLKFLSIFVLPSSDKSFIKFDESYLLRILPFLNAYPL